MCIYIYIHTVIMNVNWYVMNVHYHGISWDFMTNPTDRWPCRNCHVPISLSHLTALGIPGWLSWLHNFQSPAPENARDRSWLKKNWLSSRGGSPQQSKKSCKSLWVKMDSLRNMSACVTAISKASVLLCLDIHQDPPHSSLMSLLCTNLMLVSFRDITLQWPHWTKKAMAAFSSPQFRSPPEGKLRDGQTQDKPRWSRFSTATKQALATQWCKAGTIWFTCDLNLICAGGATPLQTVGYQLKCRAQKPLCEW